MKEDKNYFYLENNGKKIKYKIIKIIAPSNGKYQYIVYTENGNELYSSRYYLKNNEIYLENIEYQYEFDYIDRVLEGETNDE